MSVDFNNVGAVILAAGLGKRMKSAKLKVMHELDSRPLVDYVVGAIEASAVGRKPIVVVCDNDPSVQNFLNGRAEYVVQAERLGTGHAVRQAELILKDKIAQVVVLYGDMPFVRPESINSLIKKHREKDNKVTLMTVVAPDFNDWRESLSGYGRIIRAGVENHVVGIVEKKDATATQLEIKEVNPGFYCFDSVWLWPHLRALQNNNVQGEYYLTDLIAKAVAEGVAISSIVIDPSEAVGINTADQLVLAGSLIK
ncbi:MAG: hypothetical protein A3J93_02290 [Candidatus Magasanikbacteria bacterium RIFOXYC2_FULL_42_28]|uniref:MobA-like NTP transferase domain-containing protein n=1 Tax=Candidatus Magasanikbacteria bacterium RIFOXYC2_FULL_42_28 TaxID=1798704 RepID=A0A1F6NVK8_9BACT|nr:MAG: hypothetical protein A3J93_02290 [Candidatus Magasanikbacteria bacterium RIFOXYC2_FULL_42_28]